MEGWGGEPDQDGQQILGHKPSINLASFVPLSDERLRVWSRGNTPTHNRGQRVQLT